MHPIVVFLSWGVLVKKLHRSYIYIVVTLRNYIAGGKMHVCGLHLSNLSPLLLLWPDILYTHWDLFPAIIHSGLTNLWGRKLWRDIIKFAIHLLQHTGKTPPKESIYLCKACCVKTCVSFLYFKNTPSLWDSSAVSLNTETASSLVNHLPKISNQSV